MVKERNASMDLLRFVCMIMVVSMHYFGWGGVNSADNKTLANFVISGGISTACRAAVDCFFMLSGFFITPIKQKIEWYYEITRIAKIWFKVLLYSTGITFLFLILNLVPLDFPDLLNSAFPIMTNQYWFITVFLLITAIRPLLSRGLTNMTNKELLIVSVCLFFFDCIQPVFGHNAFGELGAGFLNAFTCVVLGYAVKTLSFFEKNSWSWLSLYVLMICIAGALAFVEKKYLHHEDALAVMYNSPFIMVAAVGLLSFFKSLSFSSTFITGIAPYVLGIYLINDHPLMRQYCWENVLHCSSYYSSNFMFLHYIGCVFVFVVVGIVVDFALSKFIEKVSNHKLVY